MSGPTKKKRKDHKALIAAGSLPERSVEVCLRPDLFAEMQEVERDLQQAENERQASGGSLASGSASRELAERMEAVRQEMLEHSLTFRLRALPRRKFTALQVEFPPREGNMTDLVKGMDVEAAADSLVRRCLIEPELDEEDWANLDDKVSDGQWQLLVNAAWAINDRDVEVPFSRTASRILQTSSDE